MTKSCATHQGPGRDPGRGAALALQGGGAHGAFTWGVLDRLLEKGLEVHAICGVSSGALIGVMLAQGLVLDGRDGARAAMRTLWQRFARAHAMSPLQSAPLERWLWGWDLSNSVVWRGLEATMRLFSPAQLNAALWPFGHHPLRALLNDLIEPELLADPSAPRLFVSATDVETGEAVLFENAAITVDVLLASSCLPFVFPAVEIGGRAYWDGGYSGNHRCDHCSPRCRPRRRHASCCWSAPSRRAARACRTRRWRSPTGSTRSPATTCCKPSWTRCRTTLR